MSSTTRNVVESSTVFGAFSCRNWTIFPMSQPRNGNWRNSIGSLVTESYVYVWSSAASAVVTRIRLGGESILLEASYAVDRTDVITYRRQSRWASTQGSRGFRTVDDTSWVQIMGIRLIISDSSW